MLTELIITTKRAITIDHNEKGSIVTIKTSVKDVLEALLQDGKSYEDINDILKTIIIIGNQSMS